MKHFAKDTIAVSLIGITLLIVFLLIRPIRPHNDFVYKRDYMEKHAEDISVLIMGHSHTANSFNPSVFDSVFDLAISTRVSYYDMQLLKKYLPAMSNLKTVIMPLACEYEAGAYYINPQSKEEHSFNYWFNMGINPPAEVKGTKLLKTLLLKSTSYKYFNANRDCDSLGYEKLIGVGNNKNVHEAPNAEQYMRSSLLTMSTLCSDNNIRLIVITFPANSTYRREHPYCDSSMAQFISALSEKYPIEYQCYLNDEQFTDSLFHDQTHLNHAGATLFAQRVKADFGL